MAQDSSRRVRPALGPLVALALSVCAPRAAAARDLPFAIELSVPGGAQGFPGGPVEARLAVGPGLTVEEANGVRRAIARLAADSPPEALQVEVERDATGAPTGLVLAWVAAPVPAGSAASVRAALVGAETQVGAPAPEFTLHTIEGGREWRFEGVPVLGFMFGYDAARHADTFKTFHHLAGLHGEGWLTKGAGGSYPHQRGVFVGWDRILVGNQRHDLWTIDEALRPRQEHDTFDLDAERRGPWRARHVSRERWLGNGGVKVADERRTGDVWRPTRGALVFDVESALSPRVTTTFAGNPAHAGVHVRLAEEHFQAGRQASFLLPADAEDHPYDGDSWTARWCAARFRAGDQRYVLAQLAHPTNTAPDAPLPVFNARGYGRFGAFTEHRVERAATLTLRHRFVLLDEAAVPGGVDVALIEALWRAWVTPPSVTVRRLG
ncbi:MAG: DUF6807 family protein [Planctomycetota bacterium]